VFFICFLVVLLENGLNGVAPFVTLEILQIIKKNCSEIGHTESLLVSLKPKERWATLESNLAPSIVIAIISTSPFFAFSSSPYYLRRWMNSFSMSNEKPPFMFLVEPATSSHGTVSVMISSAHFIVLWIEDDDGRRHFTRLRLPLSIFTMFSYPDN
jgi:hypothetical protein